MDRKRIFVILAAIALTAGSCKSSSDDSSCVVDERVVGTWMDNYSSEGEADQYGADGVLTELVDGAVEETYQWCVYENQMVFSWEEEDESWVDSSTFAIVGNMLIDSAYFRTGGSGQDGDWEHLEEYQQGKEDGVTYSGREVQTVSIDGNSFEWTAQEFEPQSSSSPSGTEVIQGTLTWEGEKFIVEVAYANDDENPDDPPADTGDLLAGCVYLDGEVAYFESYFNADDLDCANPERSMTKI